MQPPLPPDLNDYIIRRKKRGAGSYKSGPYANLHLPPPNKPPEGFKFTLPGDKKDEAPELFNRQATFFALKGQKWLCAACGVLLKFSDASNWEGPIAIFKRNKECKILGYCPKCVPI